ncbi:peptidoglycan-binding protein [Sorangium sp. So ce394]|uniref:peptidoglycan-binding domain-containing protein n=1 Tax=Sorangium sp. So ce394 TaxID=3133310 RepID=UPI003F5C576A
MSGDAHGRAGSGGPGRAAAPAAKPVGAGDRVVRAGDTTVLIAEESGHFWQTLWNHPANRELKAARKHPNVLFPGDRVTVPPISPKEIACETGKRHVFRRKGIPAEIAFQLKTQEGKVLVGRKYLLRIGKREYAGVTGADGTLRHFVEATARTGELIVWVRLRGLPETVSWTLAVGDLGPVNSLSGARGRLLALGYAERQGSAMDEHLRAALIRFQTDQELTPTGEIDQATIEALERAYGF